VNGTFSVGIVAGYDPDGNNTPVGDYDTYTATYSLVINAPAVVTISISPLASTVLTGTQNVAFSQQFTASGGTASYTFSAVGQLPSGLSLTSGGLLSGTVTSSGTFGFTIRATDANSNSGTATYSLVVGAAAITGPDSINVQAASGSPPGGTSTVRLLTDTFPYIYVDVTGSYLNSRTPGDTTINWTISGDLNVLRFTSMVTIDPTGYGSPAREDPMPLALSGTAVMKPLNYYQNTVRLMFYIDRTQAQTSSIETVVVSIAVGGVSAGNDSVFVRNT
jgi:hypothetical protein